MRREHLHGLRIFLGKSKVMEMKVMGKENSFAIKSSPLQCTSKGKFNLGEKQL